MKEKYTINEILFGLRKEYLDVYKELKKLEKYVVPSNKVSNAEFVLAGSSFSDPEIKLEFETKKKFLDKLLIYFGMYVNRQTQYSLEESNNEGKLYEVGNSKLLGTILNGEELLKEIRELEKNEWFSKLGKDWDNKRISIKESKNSRLTIAPSFLSVYGDTDAYFIPLSDKFYFVNREEGVSFFKIIKLLNYKVDRGDLSSYYQGLIDNFWGCEREIVWNLTDMDFGREKVIFEPLEDEKRIILQPIHIRGEKVKRNVC